MIKNLVIDEVYMPFLKIYQHKDTTLIIEQCDLNLPKSIKNCTNIK